MPLPTTPILRPYWKIHPKPGYYVPLRRQALEKKMPDHPKVNVSVSRATKKDVALAKFKLLLVHKKNISLEGYEKLTYEEEFYYNLAPTLYLNSGQCVMYDDLSRPVPYSRRCIPESHQKETIEFFHKNNGHRGEDIIHLMMNQRVIFPNMRDRISEVIRSCSLCSQMKRRNIHYSLTPYSSTHGYPFQKAILDVVGPFESQKNTPYLLVIEDSFTQWIEAYPLSDKRGDTVFTTLEEQLFPLFGVPFHIHSRNSSRILMKPPCQAKAEEHLILLTSHDEAHPKKNHQDYAARDLRHTLRRLMVITEEPWEDLLPIALFTLRSARHGTTQLSPLEALMGGLLPFPYNMIYNSQRPTYPSMEQRRSHTRCMEDLIQQHQHQVIRQHQHRFQHQPYLLTVGQPVWVYTPLEDLQQAHTFSPFWTGPWNLDAVYFHDRGCITYQVKFIHPLTHRTDLLIVARERVAPYRTPDCQSLQYYPSTHHQLEMEEDYRAESIPPPPLTSEILPLSSKKPLPSPQHPFHRISTMTKAPQRRSNRLALQPKSSRSLLLEYDSDLLEDYEPSPSRRSKRGRKRKLHRESASVIASSVVMDNAEADIKEELDEEAVTEERDKSDTIPPERSEIEENFPLSPHIFLVDVFDEFHMEEARLDESSFSVSTLTAFKSIIVPTNNEPFPIKTEDMKLEVMEEDPFHD